MGHIQEACGMEQAPEAFTLDKSTSRRAGTIGRIPMSELNERQIGELEFWKNEVAKYPGEDYARIRTATMPKLREMWPELKTVEGTGLDVGCGPSSIFEYSRLALLFAIDPLMEEYQKMYTPEDSTVGYILGHEDDGILHFQENAFDYMICRNVIDHTAAYRQLLYEMHRTLKVGGTLMFYVNFDAELHPPEHYMLWDYNTVWNEMAAAVGFHMLRGVMLWEEEYERYVFWGVFTKKETS